jgi:LemA protein
MRFNDRAMDFNSKRDSFPTVLIAGFFPKFQEKPYFKATAGAEKPPEVKF